MSYTHLTPKVLWQMSVASTPDVATCSCFLYVQGHSHSKCFGSRTWQERQMC